MSPLGSSSPPEPQPTKTISGKEETENPCEPLIVAGDPTLVLERTLCTRRSGGRPLQESGIETVLIIKM